MISSAKKGFTLIELLVVISIIALLSSVIFASLNSARAKARDAKRLLEKRQVILALDEYYNDNGTWPSFGGVMLGAVWTCFGAPSSEMCQWDPIGQTYQKSGDDNLITAMAPYMKTFPINNADSNTAGYNRIEYHTNAPVNGITGTWIWWMQENDMSASVCPVVYKSHPDKYYYCFEFVGP